MALYVEELIKYAGQYIIPFQQWNVPFLLGIRKKAVISLESDFKLGPVVWYSL